jgi:hypothetical protein
MTDKKYFKIILFAIGFLFAITVFSVIFCIVRAGTVEDTQHTSHIMSIGYLIFHMVMEAIIFYYAFKAMVNGSNLINAVMYVKDDIVNKKSKRNSLILFIVSAVAATYLLIVIFPVNIFLSFFSLGLKFALFNFFLLLGTVSLFFFCYKKEVETK